MTRTTKPFNPDALHLTVVQNHLRTRNRVFPEHLTVPAPETQGPRHLRGNRRRVVEAVEGNRLSDRDAQQV